MTKCRSQLMEYRGQWGALCDCGWSTGLRYDHEKDAWWAACEHRQAVLRFVDPANPMPII